MVTFIAGINEFRRDLICQRTSEGLDAARDFEEKRVEENLSLMIIKEDCI